MVQVRAIVLAVVASVTVRTHHVTGDYKSNWDQVHLVQDGTTITGTYVCCGGGTIKGRIVEDRTIRFEWDEPRGAGHGAGVWTIDGNRLEGSWGFGQSATDGGPWNLERKSSQLAH